MHRLLATTVSLNPDPQALPGAGTVMSFLDGLYWYALGFALVGLLLSASLWAIGGFSANYSQSVSGKKGVMIAFAACIAIGGATKILSFFYKAGTQVDGGRVDGTNIDQLPPGGTPAPVPPGERIGPGEDR